ncbi:MAG: hypothetical protein HYR62_00360 [Actinobacteria bacterium]|nr:hypothetical protein [Actinomycetota bacterium]MBI3687815.1 hypothetical protein [Actinomycetota bacterium]
MRIYLPATIETLRQLLERGEVGSPPLRGYAVTPALREWYLDQDIEALEYAALLEAARTSLRLLDTDPKAARRRVVIAADVPDGQVLLRPHIERSAVELPEPVPHRLVASVHVDAAEAEEAVRAAAEAVVAAGLGDDDAQFVVDEAEGHELAWYATQEIGPLLELW